MLVHPVAGVHPSTPPPDFDLETSLETVERLRELDPDPVCYGHFGARHDADAQLSAYADLLSQWVDAVAAAADRHDGVEGWGKTSTRRGATSTRRGATTTRRGVTTTRRGATTTRW